MGSSAAHEQQAPVFRPTKAEFSQPFCTYVKKILRKHPDLPMFKVVPPPGWSPRNGRPFPKLSSIDINCPIKQLVFGTRGSYRCILIEQKPLTAAEFKDIAEDAHHAPPKPRKTGEEETGKGARRAVGRGEGEGEQDPVLERPFWSSVTINPPLYGADTPQSFFSENLPYGWNLRHLGGCLLHKHDVPDIAGVTTPMTYFGMWKSFFSWHVEDADLYSINYLHFGAPKVWYCVAPSHRAKFERMAASLFPELAASCSAFTRHKDILLSPSLLRTYGVEYMQTKQETNEFVVLNAGAYHAGYNTGFNCAEAVNFATDDWLEIGKDVQRCKCGALKDGVRISMRSFGLSDSSDDSSDADDDEEEDESEEDDSSAEESSEEEEEEEEQQQQRHRGRPSSSRCRHHQQEHAPAAGTKRGAAAAAAAAAAAEQPTVKKGRRGSSAADGPAGRSTKTAQRAAEAAAKSRSGRTTAEARAKLAVAAGRVRKPATAARGSSTTLVKRTTATKRRHPLSPSKKKPLSGAAAASAAARVAKDAESKAALAAAAAALAAGAECEAPQVILGEDRGRKYFAMVQVIKGVKASGRGQVAMRWLREDKDGLFRPSSEVWEEASAALVPVRTQWIPTSGSTAGGWRLLTLRSRILETELVG